MERRQDSKSQTWVTGKGGKVSRYVGSPSIHLASQKRVLHLSNRIGSRVNRSFAFHVGLTGLRKNMISHQSISGHKGVVAQGHTYCYAALMGRTGNLSCIVYRVSYRYRKIFKICIEIPTFVSQGSPKDLRRSTLPSK